MVFSPHFDFEKIFDRSQQKKIENFFLKFFWKICGGTILKTFWFSPPPHFGLKMGEKTKMSSRLRRRDEVPVRDQMGATEIPDLP